MLYKAKNVILVDKVWPLISDRSCMPIILKDPNKIINIYIYMVFKKYKSKNIDHRNFQQKIDNFEKFNFRSNNHCLPYFGTFFSWKNADRRQRRERKQKGRDCAKKHHKRHHRVLGVLITTEGLAQLVREQSLALEKGCIGSRATVYSSRMAVSIPG